MGLTHSVLFRPNPSTYTEKLFGLRWLEEGRDEAALRARERPFESRVRGAAAAETNGKRFPVMELRGRARPAGSKKAREGAHSDGESRPPSGDGQSFCGDGKDAARKSSSNASKDGSRDGSKDGPRKSSSGEGWSDETKREDGKPGLSRQMTGDVRSGAPARQVPAAGGDTPSDAPNRKASWLGDPLRDAETAPTNWLIYLHGNSCDLGDMKDELAVVSAGCAVNVVAVEYPGYGLLEGEQVDAKQIDAFARSTFYHLRRRGVAAERIWLMGRSIGTGPAARLARALLAAGERTRGLILHSPYLSVAALGEAYAGKLGTWALENVWDTQAELTAIGKMAALPVLISHARHDEVIPVAQAQALYQDYPGKKLFKLSKTSSHNEYDVVQDVCKPLNQLNRLILDRQRRDKQKREERVK